jgi:GTPase SAR1 family protein
VLNEFLIAMMNTFNEPLTKRRTQSSSAELQPNGLRRVLNKDRYRIVVMGSAAVGKTCIVSRLLYEQFIAEYRATIEELHSGEYELNGMPITLDILDTSGKKSWRILYHLNNI